MEMPCLGLPVSSSFIKGKLWLGLWSLRCWDWQNHNLLLCASSIHNILLRSTVLSERFHVFTFCSLFNVALFITPWLIAGLMPFALTSDVIRNRCAYLSSLVVLTSRFEVCALISVRVLHSWLVSLLRNTMMCNVARCLVRSDRRPRTLTQSRQVYLIL